MLLMFLISTDLSGLRGFLICDNLITLFYNRNACEKLVCKILKNE